MSTSATTSQGTQLKVLNGTTMTLIPYIMGFTGPSTQQDLEEITNLDSAGGYKEWFATLRDGGTIPFDMIWKDTDPIQKKLIDSNAAGTKDNFQILFPFTGAYNNASFQAYTTKMEPKAAKGATLKLGVELRVTGAITWA